MRRSSGSLARALELVHGKKQNSIFTIESIIEENYRIAELSTCPPKNPSEPVYQEGGSSIRDRSRTSNRARLILIKAQESAINFLFRWSMLSEHDSSDDNDFMKANSINATHRLNNYKQKLSKKVKSNKDKRNRSSLLFYKVAKLPDKSFGNVMKFIFWRWMTWTNVIELLLITLLLIACLYQCYEPIEEYYKYPTYVSVSKVMNDNFRQDLPALTICNRNRVSRQKLKESFPQFNESHFLAITLGTFYSIDNFTFPNQEASSAKSNDQLVPDKVNCTGTCDSESPNYNKMDPAEEASNTNISTRRSHTIDWIKVATFLSNNTPGGIFKHAPTYSILSSITCAQVWGDLIPCSDLKRLNHIQNGVYCQTLFHESRLHDERYEGVKEMNDELKKILTENKEQLANRWQTNVDTGMQLIEMDKEQIFENFFDDNSQFGINREALTRKLVDSKLTKQEQEELFSIMEEEKVTMNTREVVRLKVNFQKDDYMSARQVIGALLSIHSSTSIGLMSHVGYRLEPGFWYNFYIERVDYRRLPPPYSTMCHNYTAHLHNWFEKRRETPSRKAEITRLILQQAEQPTRLLPEYATYIRDRSIGSRECKNICRDEMAATKCNCWPRGRPFVPGNYIDANGTLPWCTTSDLLRDRTNSTSEVAGDDLHLQLCLKEYADTCMHACPGECEYSTFDVSQQARSWPSYESRRYTTDLNLLSRLKQEAECCATVSLIYANPASNLHQTEPKYTAQDMVTIISGNIEAWIGLSAAHTYLFLEQLYDALLEAGLITPLSLARLWTRK